MRKKKFYRPEQFPYHVTARTSDKSPFPLPISEVWQMFSNCIYLMTLSFGVRTHAFVLMNNHFHLLISAPDENLEKALDALLSDVNMLFKIHAQTEEPVFKDPCLASLIKNKTYYQHAYKYVYRNPVEAGLCSKVEAYPFSTIGGFIGLEPLSFPAFDNMNLVQNPINQLSWLNAPYPTSAFLEEIRGAFKMPEFQLSDEFLDRMHW